MRLEMEKDYWSVGPFDCTNTVKCSGGTQEIVSHEHHWTMADILNAICGSGLVLEEIGEDRPSELQLWDGPGYPDDPEALLDWRLNQHAGLPLWLTVCARR